MTENKRFTITQDFEEHHKQIRDNGHIIMGCFVEQQAEVIVNLLNEQHEQIERLKGNFRALDEVKCELADENEQLKQQIGNLEHTRDFCAECCERLEKENEELKFEIRKMQRAYEQLWEHTYK